MAKSLPNKIIPLVFEEKLYPFQQEVLDALTGKTKNSSGGEYRYLVPVLGRQTGKSYIAKRAGLEIANNRGGRVLWVAETLNQTESHWLDLVQMLESAEFPVKSINQTKKTILFYGGGVLRMASITRPDNLVGGTLDLAILDEAAIYTDGERVWQQIIQPMLTATKGKAIFPTTPRGKNYIYDLYKRGLDPKDDYYLSWNAPSHTAPHQELRTLEEIRKSVKASVWRQEYLAEFISSGGGVFANLAEAASVKFTVEPDPTHTYYCGIDVGTTGDFTVISVIDGITREQVYVKRFTDIGTRNTIREIIDVIERFEPTATLIEKNGVGAHLWGILKDIIKFNSTVGDDLAVTINGAYPIYPVDMTNEKKRDLIEKLSHAIEYGWLKILEEAHELGAEQIKEMSVYEKTETRSGNITYNAPKNYHDDMIMALAIAYSAVPRWKRFKRVENLPRVSPLRSHTVRSRKHRGGRNTKRRKLGKSMNIRRVFTNNPNQVFEEE
jgi:hypothetical protein